MRAEKNKKIIIAQTSRRSRRPKMPQFAVPFEDVLQRGKCIAAWEGESKDPADMSLVSIVVIELIDNSPVCQKMPKFDQSL